MSQLAENCDFLAILDALASENAAIGGRRVTDNKGDILAVDDTPASLKLLTDTLTAEGYQVRAAPSGELALDAAASEPPELVLLDIRMPGMDGFEVCRRLKARPETRDIPVIFISALSETVDKVSGFDLGAVDYVTKPYHREELLARVHTHLELHRLRQHFERMLDKRTAELSASEAALTRNNRELRSLEDCNQSLLRASDEQTLLNDVCRTVCDASGYRRVWVGYAEDDDARTIRPVAWAGDKEGCFDKTGFTWADTEGGCGPAGIAVRTGESACFQDFAAAPETAPWRNAALQRGCRSSVALPLRDENANTFGVLTICSREPNVYTPDEMRLLEELAGNLAFGVTALRDRIERKRAEEGRLSHLRFVESMDRVNRVIQGANDLGRMMSDVLDVVLAIFDCDRAFLAYPCDPEAAAWQVPMERSKHEYPGACAQGLEMAMDEDVARTLRELLASDRPVKFGPETDHPLPNDIAQKFSFCSFMSIAIHPKVGKPWQFGIHQCSYARVWTPDEEGLLGEIGRRLADGLTALLSYRDLQESEEKYRRIVDTATEGIWVFGPDAKTTFVNARTAELLGYSREEMTARPVTDFLFEEDAPDHFGKMERHRQGLPDHCERRFRRKDGQTVWTLASATPIFDDNHHFQGVLGMVTDITERKRAEGELRQMNERFSLAANAARLGVWDWDIPNNQLVWDDRMYELYGITREDFAGGYEAFLQGVHPDDRASTDEIVKLALLGTREYETEFRVVWPDGSVHHIKAHGQIARDAGGAPLRMTGVNFDVTERNRARDEIAKLNRELQHQVEALEEATKELETFSYSVSHDLKIPLRAIDGYACMLREEYGSQLAGEGERYVDVVRQSTVRMGKVIDGLLNFTALSRRNPQIALVDMGALAREVFEELRAGAPERNIRLRVGDLPPARCDRDMIRQALASLVGNAIKFTALRTEAVIEICGAAMDKENAYFVRDNGAGFDMRYVDKLFRVCLRLHPTEVFEGPGVGLAIVKRIIEKHGGRVWAESKLNEGATFHFTLPRIEAVN